jgi:hypothetical protein
VKWWRRGVRLLIAGGIYLLLWSVTPFQVHRWLEIAAIVMAVLMLGLRFRAQIAAVLAPLAPLFGLVQRSLGRFQPVRRRTKATAILMLVVVVTLVIAKFHGGLGALLSWRTGTHDTLARAYDPAGEAPTPIALPDHPPQPADALEAPSAVAHQWPGELLGKRKNIRL